VFVKSFFRFFGMVAIGTLVLANCTKPSDTTTQFTAVYQALSSNNCISCHTPSGAAAASLVQLDFTTEALAYSTLTTKTVSGTSSSGICGGVPIVVAGNSANSYLAAVLIASYAHSNFYKSGCTPYSGHLSDTNISATEQQTILNWIQNGAKQ
jgi:hypothetical protein